MAAPVIRRAGRGNPASDRETEPPKRSKWPRTLSKPQKVFTAKSTDVPSALADQRVGVAARSSYVVGTPVSRPGWWYRSSAQRGGGLREAALRYQGFAAWLVWLVVHLTFTTGFKNRAGALFHWTISFFGRSRAERTITAQQIFAREALAAAVGAPSPGGDSQAAK
jgi:hypothetical protein